MAISTTGDQHRLGFLETAVEAWLNVGFGPVVTVDGDEGAAARVAMRLPAAVPVYQVGQRRWGAPPYDGHQGVAVSKNTGIELLMERGYESLFLADDDTWPLGISAIGLHTALAEFIPHSMVGWGSGRNPALHSADWGSYASWSWPRGVLLFATRDVVARVGGMREEFGPGGHEHVEWSRRIHQAGLTPDLFCTPDIYSADGAWGARRFWHCEDMPKAGEPLSEHRARRRRITSIRRKDRDWPKIEKIMTKTDGDTSFVPYQASLNGRSSATMWTSHTCRGAALDEGVEK